MLVSGRVITAKAQFIQANASILGHLKEARTKILGKNGECKFFVGKNIPNNILEVTDDTHTRIFVDMIYIYFIIYICTHTCM